jgi:hypothetical protein
MEIPTIFAYLFRRTLAAKSSPPESGACELKHGLFKGLLVIDKPKKKVFKLNKLKLILFV